MVTSLPSAGFITRLPNHAPSKRAATSHKKTRPTHRTHRGSQPMDPPGTAAPSPPSAAASAPLSGAPDSPPRWELVLEEWTVWGPVGFLNQRETQERQTYLKKWKRKPSWRGLKWEARKTWTEKLFDGHKEPFKHATEPVSDKAVELRCNYTAKARCNTAMVFEKHKEHTHKLQSFMIAPAFCFCGVADILARIESGISVAARDKPKESPVSLRERRGEVLARI